MKREIHPALVAVVLTLVVCGAGFLLYMRTGGFGPETLTPEQNPMPKEAGEQMQKMMQGVSRQRREIEEKKRQEQQKTTPSSSGSAQGGP
jgi:uncharacterized membrane protein